MRIKVLDLVINKLIFYWQKNGFDLTTSKTNSKFPSLIARKMATSTFFRFTSFAVNIFSHMRRETLLLGLYFSAKVSQAILAVLIFPIKGNALGLNDSHIKYIAKPFFLLQSLKAIASSSGVWRFGGCFNNVPKIEFHQIGFHLHAPSHITFSIGN